MLANNCPTFQTSRSTQLNNKRERTRRSLTRATVLESPWFQDTDKESRKTPNSNSHMFHSSVKRHPRLQLTLHFSDSTGYKLQAMRPTTPYHHCTLYSACLVGLTFSSTVFPRRAILYKRQPNAPPIKTAPSSSPYPPPVPPRGAYTVFSNATAKATRHTLGQHISPRATSNTWQDRTETYPLATRDPHHLRRIRPLTNVG